MVTVLIGSCDKYEFLWEDFYKNFNKYFEPKLETYLISETIISNMFNTILCGKTSYSNCLKIALNKVQTPYVMWFQDDYILTDYFTNEDLNKYLEHIEQNNIDRFGIHEDSQYYTKEKGKYWKLLPSSMYRISMQVSIWKTDFFKQSLIHYGSETPWEFELEGTKRVPKNAKIEFDEKCWYFEAMRKGQPTEKYKQLKNVT